MSEQYQELTPLRLGCETAKGKEGDKLLKALSDKTGKTVEGYTGKIYYSNGKPPKPTGLLKTVTPESNGSTQTK
jgi:hypothetical protein